MELVDKYIASLDEPKKDKGFQTFGINHRLLETLFF